MRYSESDVFKLVRDFVESCPKGFDFPCGALIDIPIEAEAALIKPFTEGFQVTNDFAEKLRNSITREEAYSLVIFTVRMGIFAVRVADRRFLEQSLWGMCIDDGLVDWRDILIALSIIEDCAPRIASDFPACLSRWARIASDRRKRTIQEGYLTRSVDMRNVEVMGYKAATSKGGALTYERVR